MKSDSTRFERGILKSSLHNFIKDESIIIFDGQNLVSDLNDRMILLDFFNGAIAIICFSLSLFQLIVSVSANIRDNMWELGVLRAMGMTKAEVVRITLYESLANSLSSITLGFVIGLIIAVTLVGQFMLMLELPFSIVVSFLT